MEKIYLRTLTPIWTGNIEKDSKKIKETGIIGSLRWWCEILMRGLDKKVCNPIKSPCNVDGSNPICSVCSLFGCNGYGRRFRLEIFGVDTLPLFFISDKSVYQSNGNWLVRIFNGQPKGRGRDIQFFFKQKMLWNPQQFEIKINQMFYDNDYISSIYFLIWFISQYGGLGAKTQNGFGQIEMLKINKKILKEGKNYLMTQRVSNHTNDNNVFNLKNFFSFDFEIKDKNPYLGVSKEIGNSGNFNYENYFIPCAFDVRYKMKSINPYTHVGENWGLRPFIQKKFGTDGRRMAKLLLGDDRKRDSSKIFVSHLFKRNPKDNYNIRVWGFIPQNLDKEKIKDIIKEFICHEKTFYNTKITTEFNMGDVFN